MARRKRYSSESGSAPEASPIVPGPAPAVEVAPSEAAGVGSAFPDPEPASEPVAEVTEAPAAASPAEHTAESVLSAQAIVVRHVDERAVNHIAFGRALKQGTNTRIVIADISPMSDVRRAALVAEGLADPCVVVVDVER